MVARLPTLQTPVHSAPTRLSESLRDVDAQDAVASANAAAPPAALDPVELATLTPANPAEPTPTPTLAAPEAPKIVTGPSSMFAADPALAPMEHSVPALPAMPAAPRAPAPATAAPLSYEDLMGAPATGAARRKPKKSKGRWLVRLLMLGGLGAAGYFGVTEGPALYERYVEGVEPNNELDAPLAFPSTGLTNAPIRTAEFTLTGLPETPGVEYRVTTDFETAVSQVDITRENGPDLQVLTFGDDAMIRRIGGEQWYVLERGQFPLDGRLDRADWVRRLDELLPTSIRSQIVIDDATQSNVSNVATRRLSLTLDAGLLVNSDPLTDVTEPVAGETVAVPAPQAATDVPVNPSNAVVPPVEPVEALPTSGPTQIEIWVDADGLIRQVSGAPQLGADTITIVRTSSESWVPQYPSPEEITTLTASALVDLGI